MHLCQVKSLAIAVCGWTMLCDVTTAHSWIACTDYLEMNGEDWKADQCRAFPRHGHQYTPKNSFGQDTGYNIINPPDNSPCRTQRNDSQAYNDDYPMAVYYAGQVIVITHPTKNHVADTRCTNKYIPDYGNRIWIGPQDAQSDVTLTQFRALEIADLGVSPTGHNIPNAVTEQYPKVGYQNAPKFCQNQDKSLATNNFTLPSNTQPGTYTLMWGWFFNSMTDLYTSCWEAQVVATKQERDAILQERDQSTAEPTNLDTGTSPPATVPPGQTPARPGQTPAPPGPTDSSGECDCRCPGSGAARETIGLMLLCVTLLSCLLALNRK